MLILQKSDVASVNGPARRMFLDIGLFVVRARRAIHLGEIYGRKTWSPSTGSCEAHALATSAETFGRHAGILHCNRNRVKISRLAFNVPA
jgi:hypothetical protein